MSEYKVQLDAMDSEKTRAAHDIANLTEELHQSEARCNEIYTKHKEQVLSFITCAIYIHVYPLKLLEVL